VTVKRSGCENENGSGNCCCLGVFCETWVEEIGFWRRMATSCVSAVLGMETESRMMSMTVGGGDLDFVFYPSHRGHDRCLLSCSEMVICLWSDFGDEAGRRMGLLNADVGGEESVKVTQTRVVCPMQVMVTCVCYRLFFGRLLVEHMSLCL
jgi:hypothetical protein